jgi:hypothetical protein
MKSKLWVAAVVGLLATSLSATMATAQVCTDYPGIMIKFDGNAWSYETAYTPATFSSASGSQLTVVGAVSLFCGPFIGLNPLDPVKEYTFIWDGLTSQGTTTQVVSSTTTRYITQYLGGNFRIYEGPSRNAPTALELPSLPPAGVVPGAFVDGTLILSGAMDPLTVTVTRSGSVTYTYSGNFRANYHATGGAFYNQVGNATNLLSGAWCPVPASNPTPASPLNFTCQLPAGWSAHPNGKWDMPLSVPALPSTWGTIKSMYR